jgi:hypothetical protein
LHGQRLKQQMIHKGSDDFLVKLIGTSNAQFMNNDKKHPEPLSQNWCHPFNSTVRTVATFHLNFHLSPIITASPH